MIINSISGGGMEINGIIKKYTLAAGNNISAGDFVSHIISNNYGALTILQSSSYSEAPSAVALDNERVFVVYGSTSAYIAYAVVCTIDGTTITSGTPLNLNANDNSAKYTSCCKLADGKVFCLPYGKL